MSDNSNFEGNLCICQKFFEMTYQPLYEQACTKETVNLAIDNLLARPEILAVLKMNSNNVLQKDGTVSPEFERTLRYRILSSVTLTVEEGVLICGGNVTPWTEERWKEAETYYWDCYKKHLKKQKGWNPRLIERLDWKTDEILDHCGDPKKTDESWQIRGLVVGEVQSGKTAAYTALINKAADAGYNVIIVLAGMTENLRKQTLLRLEQEFIGKYSDLTGSTVSKNVQRSKLIERPEGKIRNPISLSSTSQDFSVSSRKLINFSLDAVNEPVILVVKKNKQILENLKNWLKDKSNHLNSKSLMLIDDESDNASVNTNDFDADRTKINKGILDLLSLFKCASYIGFTATPYANILIDPDSSGDLFPRDFICLTDIPSNYFGLYKLFGQDNDEFDDDSPFESPYIRMIDDQADCLPVKHKNDARPKVSNGLRRAIYQFLLVNAIRDLNKEELTDRTMMVNVTRFTKVQNRLFDEIENELSNIRSMLEVSRSTLNPVIKGIREEFDREYSDCGHSWESIINQLYNSCKNIRVALVNSSRESKDNPLDYKNERGTRVIAVGGLGLSRGLTLEGLCISYLSRTTMCADALTQMGRWFGYRDSYLDLCRVWLTVEMQDRFRQTAVSQFELYEELREMNRRQLTPNQWGLKVQQSPGAFLITSRNKMRYAEKVSCPIAQNVSGKLIEAYGVREQDIDRNESAVLDLWRKIKGNQVDCEGHRMLFRGVAKEIISDFVRSFATDPSIYLLQSTENAFPIPDFISETEVEKLQTWDIVFINSANNKYKNYSLDGDIELYPLGRTITDLSALNRGAYILPKKRISAADDELGPLDKNDPEIYDDSSLSRTKIRKKRTRPLLIVLPVVLKKNRDSANTAGKEQATFIKEKPVFFYSLSFCQFDDNSDKKLTVDYIVNRRWLEQHMIGSNELDDEDAE